MKNIFTFVLALIVACALNAQTADEVINKYIAAAGGKEKLQAIKSLQYSQNASINSPMGAIEINMTYIKVDNKLFRLNTSSELFGSGFSVVTDTSGWVYIPGSPFTGTEATLQKLKPEEQKAFRAQMACDGFFPELVNYAAKGYTAELAGETKVSGRPSYKVKLKKDKEEWMFMIDKQSGLVNSMTVKGAAAASKSGMGNQGMNGGKSEKMELTFEYSNYQDVNGIKFPGKMTLQLPMGTIASVISGVKVNAPVDAKWYRPQ